MRFRITRAQLILALTSLLLGMLLVGGGEAYAQKPSEGGGGSASPPSSTANPWRTVSEKSFPVIGQRWIVPTKYRTLAVDLATLDAQLATAPPEQPGAVRTSAAIIAIPLPDGSTGHFRYVDSPILAPALAAQYPTIHTYLGQGIDDPSAVIRFDRTPAGFHAMILAPSGRIFIDPYSSGDTAHY